MLSIQKIRDHKREVLDALTKRGRDFTGLVEVAIDNDEKRRKTQFQLDSNLAEANQLAKEIGSLYKEGRANEAEEKKSRTAFLKEMNKSLADEFAFYEKELQETLYQIPNTPHISVPEGKTPDDNVVAFEKANLEDYAHAKIPHWELCETYDLIDFKLGTKITGAGFPVYTGKGAKLQRALINFFLQEGEKSGYYEIMPPLVVNEASGYGTGQLPDKEGQMYFMPEDNFYLIPTAEVPITNIFRDVILDEDQLPIRRMGYTPCFRREAGSYGKDVRGLNRLHQFDKVEIVEIANPSNSYERLEAMVAHVQNLLELLELPYRILKLCGGDMGFTSALTYDFEVYSAAQKKWLEVSSVSNFESFQANRLQCRFKKSEGTKELVHTLNGSALALPRILAALLENNQSEDGISIPKALVPFTGFSKIENPQLNS